MRHWSFILCTKGQNKVYSHPSLKEIDIFYLFPYPRQNYQEQVPTLLRVFPDAQMRVQ